MDSIDVFASRFRKRGRETAHVEKCSANFDYLRIFILQKIELHNRRYYKGIKILLPRRKLNIFIVDITKSYKNLYQYSIF